MENKCLECGGAAWEEGAGNTPGGTPGRLESPSLHSGLGVSRPAPTGICVPSQFLPSWVPLRGSSQGDTQTPTPLRAGEHRTTRAPSRKGPDSLQQS